MQLSKLKIVVIDDNFTETEPLLIHLKLNFKEAEIVLKKKAKEGLDYIMDNLDSRMIVLLDYDLGKGEPNGTEILLKIREKTSLVYIIIITAKLLVSIPHKDLMLYVNKDALAVVDKTASLDDKLNFVKDAVHSMDVRVDCIGGLY